MTVDTTLQFEKLRNRPVKYDRELMGTTIRAMKRVSEIKAKREEAFYKKRMEGVKAKEKAKIRVEIEQNIDLIAPAASRVRQQTNVTTKSMAKQASKTSSKSDKMKD